MKEVRKANIFTLIEFLFIQLGASFVLMFVLLVIGVVGNMMNKIDDIQSFFTAQLSDTSTLLITSQVAIFIPTLVYLFAFKGWKNVPFKFLGPVKILLLILLTLCIYPVVNFVAVLSMLFVKEVIGNATDDIVNTQPFTIGLLMMALMPAIGEELFCRGILYGSYRKVNRGRGILLSAIMFGFLHGNFNQFIYTVLMGIIFALTVEVTDSILSSMIMHFIFNGTTVVVMYLPQLVKKYNLDIDISQFETTEDLKVNIDYVVSYLKSSGGVLIGATVGAVVILYVLALVNGKNLFKLFSKKEIVDTTEVIEEKKEDEDIIIVKPEVEYDNRLITMPLAVAMVLQFACMIYVEIGMI